MPHFVAVLSLAILFLNIQAAHAREQTEAPPTSDDVLITSPQPSEVNVTTDEAAVQVAMTATSNMFSSTPQPGLPDLVASAEAAAARAELAAINAEKGLDRSFELLNLFEVFGAVFTLLIPVLALVAGFFGLRRLQQLNKEVDDAMRRFEDIEGMAEKMLDARLQVQEIAQLVTKALTEIEARTESLSSMRESTRLELLELREQLERSTSNAVLALSFLPLGESQYKSGDFKGAIDIYQRALKLDTMNPIINYRLGYAYTQSGRLEEAERYLQAALAIEADFAPALATLGYVYRRRGEKMEEGIERIIMLNLAEKNLARALELSPKLVDADGESWWGSLGGLFRRRGETDRAIYAYTQASIVTPNSSYVFSNLALLYMQKNDRLKMIETYEKVEKLAADEAQADINNYWAYNDLVTSRLALGMIPEAEKALDRVFTTTPDDAYYALEALLFTVIRLADVLESEKGEVTKNFIERIKTQTELREQRRRTVADETSS